MANATRKLAPRLVVTKPNVAQCSVMPDMEDSDLRLLKRAVDLATESVAKGGGPFACVIVHKGRIISEGTNQVTQSHDPSAHAEVVAIRKACQALGSFQLEGCDIYTSCEPCPMCLGAIYWARPRRVFFAATKSDAASAGFDDRFIYQELMVSPADRKIPFLSRPLDNALAPFRAWSAKPDRVEY